MTGRWFLSPCHGRLHAKITSARASASVAIELPGAVRPVAFPYAQRPTDFLVIRSRSGALSLRQLSGTIIAGQQEPNMVVPVPRSKEARCALCVSLSRLVAASNKKSGTAMLSLRHVRMWEELKGIVWIPML